MSVVAVSDVAATFWQKVDRTGECWLWLAGTSKGRPVFTYRGIRESAHRFAWELGGGALPSGMIVKRTCREPLCVRHLYIEPLRRIGTEPVATEKRCRRCQIVKPALEFQRKAQKVDGLESYCRRCAAARQREANLARYGLTGADYQQMLERQDGLCAACGEPPGAAPRQHHLVIDHNHKEGVVRGLLCSNCNIAIGHAQDDPVRLRHMADYLERVMR